jgi:hypothetical protein
VRGSACCYFGASSARLSRLAPNCTHPAGATRLSSLLFPLAGCAPLLLPPRPPLRKSTIHLRARRPGERSGNERAQSPELTAAFLPAASNRRRATPTCDSVVPRYVPLRKRPLSRKLRASATCNGRSPSRPTPHRGCCRLDRIQCVLPPFARDVDRRATRVLIPRQILPSLPVTWRPFVFRHFLFVHGIH